MKYKFELLNDVKIDIDKYKEVKFDNNDELKKRMKSKIKAGRIQHKKGLVVASLVLILASGFVFNDKGWAQIKDIWYSMDEILNINKDKFNSNKYEVNKIVEDNNVKILFKSVMLSDENILIDMNIDDTKFNPFVHFTEKQQKDWNVDKWANGESRLDLSAEGVKVYLDGNKMTYKNATQAPESKNRKEDGTMDIVSYQSIGAIGKDNDEFYRVNLSEDQFPYIIDREKIYNLKIKINKIHIGQKELTEEQAKEQGGRYGGVIRGDWSVDVDIKGEDLVNNISTNNINESIELDFHNKVVNVELQQVKAHTMGISLKYKMDNINEIFGFKVVNDKGQEYQFSGAPGSSDENDSKTMNVEAEYMNTVEDTEYIKLIPFIRGGTEEGIEYEDKSIKIKIDK